MVGRGGSRRAGRRAGRRAARRTTRRVMRRRRRRRLVVGGMVLLAVGGGAAAVKLTQRDTQRIEEHAGGSVEELSEEELVAAMRELGIQSVELSPEDTAALAQDEAANPPELEDVPPASVSGTAETPSYIQELQQLGALRDQGILTDEEFEAEKKRILGR